MSKLKRGKFINSITDWFLIGASLVLFGLEMLAALGYVPFITNELVKISVFQIWVPVVLGILAGHMFPLPWGHSNLKILLTSMFSGIGIYVLWYIYAPEAHVIGVLDILAEYLYAFFLGGYALGSTFFGRPRHPLED